MANSRPIRLLLLAPQLEASSLLADPFVSTAVGPAAKYGVSLSTLSPNPGDTINVFAQLEDSAGNAVATSGLVVTWSHTGGGSFSAGTSTTDASGLATVQFTVGSAGDVEDITATDTNSMTGISSQITVQGGGTKYLVTASSYSPITGVAITITAQLADASNNPVAISGRTVNWTHSSGGTLGASSSTTDASGIATVTFTAGSAGDVETVTATDTNGLTGTTSNITVGSSGTTPDAAIQALVDGLLDAGTITFYAGPRPQSIADAISGATALGDFTFDTPAAPLANLISASKIELNVLGGTVYTNGTAAWARAVSLDNATVIDFDVSTTPGTNVVEVNSTAWTNGQMLTAVQLTAEG